MRVFVGGTVQRIEVAGEVGRKKDLREVERVRRKLEWKVPFYLTLSGGFARKK